MTRTKPFRRWVEQGETAGDAVAVAWRGGGNILRVGVPVADEVEAGAVYRVDFLLLGHAIRLVGVPSAPITPTRIRRFGDNDFLAVEPGEELSSSLTFVPAHLPVREEVVEGSFWVKISDFPQEPIRGRISSCGCRLADGAPARPSPVDLATPEGGIPDQTPPECGQASSERLQPRPPPEEHPVT